MRSGLALVALVAVSTVPAAGQDERPERPGMRRGTDIESIMSLRDRLELDEEQIAQLDAVRAETVERRSAERAALDEMRSRLRAGQIERSEMMAFMEERRDARGDEAEGLQARVDEILQPDQRATLEQYQAERRAFERGRRSARGRASMRSGRGGGERTFRRGAGPARGYERGFERGFRRGPRGPGGGADGAGEPESMELEPYGPMGPGAGLEPGSPDSELEPGSPRASSDVSPSGLVIETV